MDSFCEHKAFYDEAISFYQCGQIVQESDYRVQYDEIDLFGPLIYLYRHAAELLFKALIIKLLFIAGKTDWQAVKLKSNNRKLSATHSIYELYVAWKELSGDSQLGEEKLDLLEYYIENINKYDEDSTFFRYPVDKAGNRNKKAMTEQLDEELLSSLPCHLGAFVYAKGPENFACLHREQFMENLEFDLVDLINLLIELYQGSKTA
ncbi:MAG: hypothetical protein II249_06680 [Bacteroidaceae bacterium]|jgi:hypothetical protein|nr:hypothetical protein [Bacteroidaceae bacterium]